MVPGPTQLLNPSGSSIGAAVFAGLTSVTDRQTEHATRLVRIGRIYVCSTAMHPKNTYITHTGLMAIFQLNLGYLVANLPHDIFLQLFWDNRWFLPNQLCQSTEGSS